MSNEIDDILTLSDRLGAHLGITHWAVSMRVSSKGDFLDRLRNGSDLRTKTAARVLLKFHQNWPADLEWPSDIPRPVKPTESRQ